MNKRQSFTLGTFGVIEFDSVLLEQPACYAPILPSCQEMSSLDAREISSRTPSSELMQRAARSVTEEIKMRFPSAQSFLVLVGPGNNGGDGLAVARLLMQGGHDVTVVAVPSEKRSAEWEVEAAQHSTIAWYPSAPEEFLRKGGGCLFTEAEVLATLSKVDVVIDALLGIGQNRPPQGAIASLVTLLTSYPTHSILSIDQPTGVNADTGEVYSPCVHAGVTVAIQAIKRGMLQFPGRSMCGEIAVKDIGINCVADGKIHTPSEFSAFLGTELPILRTLSPEVHKGKRGSVLIVGGSRSMPGAPALAAIAALRTGAGLVTVASKSSWGTFEYVPPEVMRIALPGERAQMTVEDLTSLELNLDKFSAVVIGPGMGDGSYGDDSQGSGSTKQFTNMLMQMCAERGIPLVLDASGIHHMVGCQFPTWSASRSISPSNSPENTLVITPHPGEGAALLECTTDTIQKDRFSAVRLLANRCNGVALLKGAGTLIHNGRCGYVVPIGSPYLATAGSGDVLTGVVAAYLSQGRGAFLAAAAAAYHHAWAGCAAAQSSTGVTASDIASALGRLTADAYALVR